MGIHANLKIKFIRFNPTAVLPRERKQCLVLVGWRKKGDDMLPPTLAVGWVRRSSKPVFVVPGVGGPVTHYADCLGDDFPTRSDWHLLSEAVVPEFEVE